MGQTERGSYVLTIHSPVAPELRTETPADQPFERQVTQTLTRSLVSLRSAAQRALDNGDLQPFRTAVQHGVSANLCDALVGLGQISPRNGVEVSVTWSKLRPAQELARWSMRIQADLLPVMQEASRLFKETEPVEEFELLGFVERLERPVGAALGTVSVSALMDGQARRVVIELGESDYQQAVQGHQQSRPVSCTGDLVREGRGLRLRTPHDFQVVRLDEESR